MRSQITQAVRAGERIEAIADRVLALDDPLVELPRHVQELREAANLALETGDRNLLEAEIARWERRVDELGEALPGGGRRPGAFSVRSATQEMIRRLRRAQAGQVDEIVNRWVIDRAQHQARVVARTEAVGAFRDAYLRSTGGKPYVKGYRWLLSNRHPKADECDVFAGQDGHGLGPGGYPVGQVPMTPHPNDLCSQVAIIDERHFERELAAQEGGQEPPRPWESGRTESDEGWLRLQPAAKQREILGPTRFELFQDGTRVLREGVPIPVRELVGERPRSRPERAVMRPRPVAARTTS